jgi:AraC-like DNA-binding protein
MILAASLRFITRGYLEITNQDEHIANFSKSVVYIFGFALPPLYFKQLIFPKSRLDFKSLIHFILPIIIVIENKLHLLENLFQVELNGAITFMITAIAIYYTTAIYLMLRKHIWRKTGQIEMETEQTVLLKRWTFVLFITFTLMAVRLMFTLLFMQEGGFISDNYFVWINSLAWFVVFMMIITSPSIINGYIGQISRNRQEGAKSLSYWRLKAVSPITNLQDIQLSEKINGDLDDYFIQIDQYIKKELFFRQSDLTINDLALNMKIPKSHLSFIFKYHSTLSFSDFKKLNRIQDAITLIEEGYLKTNTFDSLSKKVGFSTYNTFFIAFKEVTGKAPQEYVNSAV